MLYSHDRQISAKSDDSVTRPGAAPSFDVNVLLGRRDDPLLLIYARQLVEAISKSSSRPLLLSISLRERDPATFEKVMEWVRPLL
jgi:proteasome assembly chaperone 3